MNFNKFRLFSLTTSLVLMILLTYVSASESTHDRIEKHREWLKRRTAEKISAGYVESSDPYQKIKYFKKLIKFKNTNDPSSDEVSFVPHLNNQKDVMQSSNSDARSNNDDESTSTTVIIDTGSKFAYDTIINNGEFVFAANNTTDLGNENSNNRARNTKPSNEVIAEQSSTERRSNIVNENNEKQKAALDTPGEVIKSQMEGSSKEHIGKSTTGDVDTKSNRQTESSKNKISAVANNTSAEKSSNDFEIRRFISEHIKYKENNVTVKKSWGKWSPWSSCSRSCGEGVMSQSRECSEKIYKNGKRINITTIALIECIGFYKRFRICNEMDCPKSDVDFRAQQCSEFNNQSFRGQTYNWEPYIKDDAECELNCRPVNQKYFARLKEYAVDGTHCEKIQNPPKNNITYERGVCVEGKCKMRRSCR